MQAWEMMAVLAKLPCETELVVSVPGAVGEVKVIEIDTFQAFPVLVTEPVEMKDEDEEEG